MCSEYKSLVRGFTNIFSILLMSLDKQEFEILIKSGFFPVLVICMPGLFCLPILESKSMVYFIHPYI